MSLKSVFYLAGTVFLVAGCSNGVTAPGSATRGGAAASASATAKTPKVATPTTGTATATSDDPVCRNGYFVFSGRTDSVCLDDILE